MSLSSPPSRLIKDPTTPNGQIMRTYTMCVFGFVTLFSLVHVCIGQLPACYYADGTQAIHDVPCDPDASTSACCGRRYICATNLYCLAQDGQPNIGSCTDPTWESGDCPLALSPSQFPFRSRTLSASYYFLFTKQILTGHEVFDFNQVTNCSDGTFCPNLSN